MISDTAPRSGEFRRLYFLKRGKSHAPATNRDTIPVLALPRVADYGVFQIHDINVRVEPNGARWHDQQGRTVSYIVNWFNRHERKFPNDADRYWYIWGFEAE